MAKIYIAALYSRMMEMREMVKLLEQAGHISTARWIAGGEENQFREAAALMDIADIDNSDTVISFVHPRGTLTKGGGRHVEYGYAYALGKRLIIVGEKGEHVFHYLPKVEHYPTFDEALDAC